MSRQLLSVPWGTTRNGHYLPTKSERQILFFPIAQLIQEQVVALLSRDLPQVETWSLQSLKSWPAQESLVVVTASSMLVTLSSL